MNRRELVILGGAAIASPFAARAQQKATPVIGYLHFGSADLAPTPSIFLEGLKEAGFMEGQNVAMEYRWAEGHYDRLPELAADLVGHGVDLIAAVGPPAARAAKNATSAIPIVFLIGTDPVRDGLVASLAHPGGNVTGVATRAVEVVPKRLELLCDLNPRARVIAMLVNPNSEYAETMAKEAQEAARARGVQLPVVRAGTEGEIDAAFTSLGGLHADGLLVGDDVFFRTRHQQIVSLAARHAIPATYYIRQFVDAGGLMSYGVPNTQAYRQWGSYSGRVLKGDKPADLPVMVLDKLELVINLKTAVALGLTVPQSLLARADDVIE